MRCLHAALGLALGLLPLTAADPTTGLGAFITEDTSTLLVPFQLTPRLRLEGLTTFTRSTGSGDATRREFGLGAGLFHVRPLADDFQLYAGARFTYITTKVSFRANDDFTFDGYSANPLLGIEYKMNRHFSLAGEVGVQGSRYQMRGHAFPGRGNGTNWSSQNNLVLRTWF